MTAHLHRVGGAGPDLLLIHGFGADRLSWAATAPAFLATRTVWAVDLPGHGTAGNEVGDGSPATLARSVATAIAPLSRPFAVVGHSLGGAVALHLAEEFPASLSALVLIAPAGLGASLDREFLRGLAASETPEGTEALLHRLVSRPRLIAPAMVQHVLASLAEPGRRDALRTIASALPGCTLPPLPPEARLIWGADDRINPPDSRLLPADALILPETGHLPHVEAASRVNRAIAAALA